MDDLRGGPAGTPGLVDRVKGILLQPNEEWAKIDVEPVSVPDVYRGYIIPLAAIWPVCSLIGLLLLGSAFVFKMMLAPLILHYVLTLIMVYVFAVIIDTLAPNFKGTSNRLQAFKVATYSMTAVWVAGVFGLIPYLGLLILLGALYSAYLLYLGLPRLMKVPQDQAVTYTVVVIVVAIVIGFVLGGISMLVSRVFAPSPMIIVGDSGTVSGTITVPGVGEIDLAKAEAASKRAQASAEAMVASMKGSANGTVKVADPDVLQNLLPASLGGAAKADTSSASGGAGGIGGSHAEASYGSGASRITLSVTDSGALGAFAGAMGGAMNVQSSSKTEHGYEKMSKIDGRMTTEKWNSDSSRGTYSVLVGDRFMVTADGGGTIDALKSAVGQVNFAALEQLAKA